MGDNIEGFVFIDNDYMVANNSGLSNNISNYYYLSEYQLNWQDANDTSESLGGHLVTINSVEENEYVANIDGIYQACGNNCSGFWMGMYRDDNLCTTTDEISVTFSPEGCTDELACNYDSNAVCDDNSCEYIEEVDLGNDITTCNESVTLDAGEGYDSYLWSNGETSQTIEVNQSGNYSVSVENGAINNYSMSFDGDGDYISYFVENFNVIEDFSVSFWIKTSSNNFQRI